MKNLRFQSLTVLSEREKCARTIEFDPRLTVIKGENDTGKSSMMKTLYRTFGAEPHSVHPTWDALNPISWVTFTLDGQRLCALREQKRISIMDMQTSELKVDSRSITKDLAPALATLFNFRLQLQKSGNEGQTGQALPAFMFLPFYFDQDMSWTKSWAGFNHLSQFTSWKKDVIDYHCGIRPAEYYVAKMRRQKELAAKSELEVEKGVVVHVRTRLSEELPDEVEVNFDAFQREIDELLIEAARLKKLEDKYRGSLMTAYSERDLLTQQKAVVEATRGEITGDLEYVTDLPDVLTCPTCGSEHENNFVERFRLAQDEEYCNELLAELSERLSKANGKILADTASLGEIMSQARRVAAILEKKQGEVTLGDIVRSAGRRELRNMIQSDLDDFSIRIGKRDEKIEKEKKAMEKYESKERSQEARLAYEKSMERYLSKLNVQQLTRKQYGRLDCTLKESGSDQPRALLAYYLAILDVVRERTTAAFCPVVIDSPNQQDQDPPNWRRILKTLFSYGAADVQKIVGLVDAVDIEHDGIVVEFTKKYQVLEKEQYEPAKQELASLRLIRGF